MVIIHIGGCSSGRAGALTRQSAEAPAPGERRGAPEEQRGAEERQGVPAEREAVPARAGDGDPTMPTHVHGPRGRVARRRPRRPAGLAPVHRLPGPGEAGRPPA